MPTTKLKNKIAPIVSNSNGVNSNDMLENNNGNIANAFQTPTE